MAPSSFCHPDRSRVKWLERYRGARETEHAAGLTITAYGPSYNRYIHRIPRPQLNRKSLCHDANNVESPRRWSKKFLGTGVNASSHLASAIA